MRVSSRLLSAFLFLLMPAAALAGLDASMMRMPDVSDTQIAFVYAGDIWVAPKEGGMAQRLSTPAGQEALPRFSPDGRSIAFTGNYDGNQDVYTVATGGGVPTRLTHHPAPDRTLACWALSVVKTPKMTGIWASSDARVNPPATAWAI